MPSAVSSSAAMPSCFSIFELFAFKSAYPTGVSLDHCKREGNGIDRYFGAHTEE